MSRFTLFPKSRRMMTCRRVGEKLQAYLDGEVDDLSNRRIAHHLEDCRRCGMELDVYTRDQGQPAADAATRSTTTRSRGCARSVRRLAGGMTAAEEVGLGPLTPSRSRA